MQRDVILIYGPTGSGKTTLAGEVLKNYSRVLICDASFGEFNATLFNDIDSLLNMLDEIKAFPDKRLSVGGVPSRTPFRYAYTPMRNERGLMFETALGLGACLFVLEEADRFDNTEDLPEYDEAIIRGRHDGLSILAIGLHPSLLPKDLRRDATQVFSFGLTDPDDLDALAEIVGPKIYDLPAPEDGRNPPHPYLHWRRGKGAEIISPSGENKALDKNPMTE